MDTPTSVLAPAHTTEHEEASATSTEAQLAFTLDLNRLSQLDTQFDVPQPRLTELDDAHLINLAAHARRLEACAFRLRGACSAALRRRIRTKLAGGRGRCGTSAVGVGAHLIRHAAHVGASVSTLKTNARIHEVFFAGSVETRFACEPTLAREFYVTALTAPDPHAAIHHAVERRAGAIDYSREDFRRDVLVLKQSARLALACTTVKTAPKPAADLCIRVIPEAHPVLAELVNLCGRTPETIVAEALLAYHKSLTLVQRTPAIKNQRQAAKALSQPVQPSLLGSS